MELAGDRRVEKHFKGLVNLEQEIENEISTLSTCSSLREMTELDSQIKRRLGELNNKRQELKLIAEEQVAEETTEVILNKLKKHKEEKKRLENSLRKALMQCKSNVQQKNEEERAMLLAGGEEAEKRRKMKTKEDMLKASEGVTESFQRISSSIYSESDRAAEIYKELGKSSTVIKRTISEHHSLDSSLGQGKQYHAKIKRREQIDKLLITLGVLLFSTVVLFVISSRLGFTFFGLFG